jgi:glycosyltransferase involved in cell wall biosynthesis
LNRSLSVILPVHNAQSWVFEQSVQILDVVAELTDRFELLLLDDGSTDATYEVARDLVRRYPQVRLLREPVRRGASLAIRQGLRKSSGDIVVAHSGEGAIDAQEIVRLWRSLRSPAPAPKSARHMTKAMSSSPFSRSASVWGSFESSRSAAPTSTGGFQLLRPGRFDDLRRSAEIAQTTSGAAALVTADERIAAIETGGAARRPNFLSRVKRRLRDFTAGE